MLVLWRLMNGLWGCRLATYMSYGGCWTAFGAAGWQPTCLRTAFAATYSSYGSCWTAFGATYRSYGGSQTGLFGRSNGGCWTAFGAVGLAFFYLLDALWGCLLATYRSYGLWGLLDGLWGCRLATYRSYGGCWTAFGAVGWQPTSLMGVAGWPLWL